jgi:hypothetical protein
MFKKSKKGLIIVLTKVIFFNIAVIILFLTAYFGVNYINNYNVIYARLFENTQEDLTDIRRQLVLGESVGPEYKDSRVASLEQFLSKYSSPLLPYAERIIEVSDNAGFHYGLLPAIAMVESNLCRKIPDNSFNCWGWGIYGKKITRFASYDEAIVTVAAGIKKEYIDKGYVSLEQIMSKYNPSNHNNWLGGVSFFLSTLD